MANESTQWLYGQLTKRGYNVGKDVEEFDSLMRSNAESRQWAYDTATKSGLNVGKDIDEFSSLVGGGSQAVASPAPPAAVAPVEASAPAAGDEAAAVKEERWNPTMEERIDNVRSVQDVVNHYRDVAKVGLDAAGRRGELYTPEGRERRKTQEFMARLSGTRVKPMGLVKPSGADADASGGGDSEGGAAPVVSPVPYGYVIGKDGKRHSQWLLPDGSLTTDFIEADKAEYVAREGRLQKQFEEQMKALGLDFTNNADSEEFAERMKSNGLDPSKSEDVYRQNILDRMETNRRRLAEKSDELARKAASEYDWRDDENFFSNVLRLSGNSVMASNNVGRPGLNDDELHNLTAENYLLSNALKRLDAAGLEKSEGYLGGALHLWNNLKNTSIGVYDVLRDHSLYVGGAVELNVTTQLMGIDRKVRLGIPLTDTDRSLVMGAVLSGEIENNTSVPRTYTAGGVTAWMLPFMATIAANPGQGISQGLVRQFGRSAIKKFGKEAIRRYPRSFTMGKAVATLAGDVAESAVAVNTLGFNKVVSNAQERYAGRPVIDARGYLAGFDGNHSVLESVAKAETSETLEYYTEKLGEHFGAILSVVGKGVAKGARRIGAGRIVDKTTELICKMGNSPWVKSIEEFEKRVQLNGVLGEVAEEEANIILNAITVGDNELSDLTDLDQQIDLVLGVGLLSGHIAALKGVGYVAGRRNAKKKLHKFDVECGWRFGEEWASMRSSIENAEDDAIAEVVRTMISNKSEMQARAVLGYARALMTARGYSLAQAKRAAERVSAAEDVAVANSEDSFPEAYYGDDVESSYDTGLDVVERFERGDEGASDDAGAAIAAVRAAEARCVEAFGSRSEEAMYRLEHDAEKFREEPWLDDLQREAVDEYMSARAALEGVVDGINTSMDAKRERVREQIVERTHVDRGVIIPAVLVNGSRVYIIKGELVMNEDGSGIDYVSSRQTVIYIIDEEGRKRSVPADEFDSVEAEISQERALQEAYAEVEGEYVPMLDAAEAAATEVEAARGGVVSPGFALNDEFTVLKEDGTPVRGTITAELDEDGRIEIQTEEPVNGNYVNRFTPAELEAMFDTYNGQAVNMSVADEPEDYKRGYEGAMEEVSYHDDRALATLIESYSNYRGELNDEDRGRLDAFRDEQARRAQARKTQSVPEAVEGAAELGEQGGISADNAVSSQGEMAESVTAEENVSASALSRVPVGENGKPDFGAADVDTAWDALVEKTGNESVASAFAANMVSVSEAELKKAEKMKPKATVDIDEFMAAENERLAAVERAKSALEHWKAVAGTKQRREAERLSAEAEEARRRASERAAEEARVRAEREEAARLEREALNGVPDWSVDTPQDARARGYRRNGPQKVDRSEIIDNHTLGNSVEVKFGDDVMQKGNVVIIEASQLQPSHRDGQRNPAHFLDEAQPKERKDAASRLAAARIAEGIRPEEITSSVTAYTGAPSVNSRGEVIQGNNRSVALRMMYEGYPDSAAKYKRYLIEHAAEFGLTREAVEAFEHPVLVNMLDVSDESAIALGQYVAQDTESGGVERIKPKNAVQKMGDKIGTFANLLLRSTDEEATFAQLVDANGVNVLKWMNRNGYITNTQYASAFDSKGNLTAEAANDLKGIMYQSVFRGGSTRLEEMFNNLPSKAQRAILATAFRDYDSAFADRMVGEIQQSVIAFNALMGYERFSDATNAESARQAVGEWVSQYAFDDVSGEPYLPSETFSNFALALAAMYKGTTQKHIQSVFNTMYDIVQGTEQDNLFEAADKTPRPLAEAIRQVLNLEYQPVKKKDNGTNGSAVLDINSEDVQEGRRGSNGNADGAEQHKEEAEPADSGTGVASDSGRGRIDTRSGESQEATQEERLSKEEATDIIAKMEMSAVSDPGISLSPETWIQSFGINNSIATPIGNVKMGEGQYQKFQDLKRSSEFGMAVMTLQDPDMIFIEPSIAKDEQETERAFSYVFVKTFIRDGKKIKYYTSVSVMRDGMEVSVSSHIANKNKILSKLQGFERAYTKESLLPNSSEWRLAEHPTDVPDLLPTQGKSENISSAGKGNTSSAEKQADSAESSDFERGLADFARRYGAGKERVSVLDREFSEWMSGRSVEELADLDVNMLNAVCNAAGLDAGKAWAFRMSIDKATPKEKLSEVFELRGQRKAGEMKGNEEAEGDVRFHTESSGDSRGDSEVYEAAKGLLESAGIEVIEVDNATAQEKLGGHDDVRLMGSRTDRKMSQVGEYYSGKELDSNQQSVVDVFSGKEDNVAIDVERAEGTARVVMRQGTENRAGAKHSLFRHFGTRAAWVTEADIAMIPEIIGKGERSVNGNTVTYDYETADGTRLRVTTKNNRGREEFTNFLSNRKPLPPESRQAQNGNTQSSARATNAEVSDAKLGNNLQYSKSNDESEADRHSTDDDSIGSTEDIDREYMRAIERGDIETAQRMVDEAAERAGYRNESDYQGTSAYNGAAPFNGYEWTKDERREHWEDGDFEGDWTLGDDIDFMGDSQLNFLLNHPNGYSSASRMQRESIIAIREAIKKGKRKIKVYRSVPDNVEEESLRNGDWVTPSLSYAKDNAAIHGWGNKYRIIEQEVDFDELWWDGNDVNEWGYDSDSKLGYKNTRNNRKLLDAVTYDDAGEVIPLSQRFDQEKSDVRYLRDSKGVVYGWTEGGKVYLNRDAMNPETPLHEYTHLWDDMVRRENPELWARGKELMKQTPLWDEVVNDPAYADIRDDEDAVASEVHSRLTGKHGAEVMQEMINRAKAKGAMETAEAVSLVERLKRWLGDMFRSLRATLGKWSKKELDGLTLEDFNNMTLRDLAEGVNPKSGEKNLVAVHNISEENLMKALDLGGFPMPSVAITKAGTGHTGFGEISLVFGKESVDPGDRHNKVYSGDAWTPTFPETGYKLNEAKTARIYDRANNAGRLPFLSAVDFHPDNYERKISDDLRSLMDAFREDYGAKQLFLSEQGNAVESFEMREVEKYTAEEIGLFEKMLEQIGVERLRNESVEGLFAELSQLIGAHNGTDLSSKKPFVAASIVKNAVRKALDYADNGNLKTEKDLEATRAKIDERINPDKYEAWLEDMFADIVEKKGIRNERDMFTPSGESRRWESLYDAVTLDNVVKAMRRQADKGGTGFFGGSIFGAAHRELKNMEDIRREAAARIRSVSDEEIETAKKRVEERLGSISLPSVEGNFSATMDFVENVREAVVKSHTAEGIYRYLSDLYPDMTMDVAKEISDIVGEIQKMSTRYLEAKPQRAVTPEEVRLAVVPEGTPAEIVKRLESFGIAVRTYERGNEHERNAIISRETSERGLRFHAAMSRGRGDFDALRERAVSERGIVMPGLNEAEVRVVEVPRHDFAGIGKEALQAAEKWGKENITGMHMAFDSEGNAFEYSISNDAVEKYVSRSATAKSENIGVHLAVLKKLPEVISESIEAEIHPDYKKNEGKRAASGEVNAESLVHRFYGAVIIEDKSYRVKTTMREFSDENMSTVAHSYEVTEIELLEAPSDNTIGTAEPLAMTSNSSIPAAKLLQGVEKSYDPGKKLLDESEIAYREDKLTNSEDGEKTMLREGDEMSAGERLLAIRALEPVKVEWNDLSRSELFAEYRGLPDVEKRGDTIQFLRTAFGKNYKAGGLFAQVVPQLDTLLEGSVLAYSEKDSLGGTQRPDGTEHKGHPNVISFDNYVNKALIADKEYYVRMTVQKTRDNTTGLHSCFVSNVDVYEKPATDGTDSAILRRPNAFYDGIVDAKLQQFFERASSELQKKEMESCVHELSERLNTPVRILRTPEEIKAYARNSREANSKGLTRINGNRATEIAILLPNNAGLADVENTVLHECVGHDGLRLLFPKKELLDNALDELYNASTDAIKADIDARAKRMHDAEVDHIFREKQAAHGSVAEANANYYTDMAEAHAEANAKREQMRRDATEEYGANVAGKVGEEGFEKMSAEELTFWGKLKGLLQRAFENLLRGLKIPKMRKWTDKEWAYIYHKAYKMKKAGGKMSVIDEAEDIVMRRRTGFGEPKLRSMTEAEKAEVRKEAIADRIEDLFGKAVKGDFTGKAVEIGRLTPEGKAYLERLSGMKQKDDVSFVLNPSDLVHIHRRHFGDNEKDGRNIPLTIDDIRQVAEIIAAPDRVLFGKEKGGNERNMFFFLKDAGDGSYNLMEIYSDKKGNLTAKSFFKSKEAVSQRAMLLKESSTLTSVTDGASLSDVAKLPKFFEYPTSDGEESVRFRDGGPSLEEYISKMKTEAMQANTDNLQAKRDAMRAIGGNLNHLRQAMARQREYDITTVKSVTDLAKILMEAGLLDDLSKFETKRILGAINNVVGKQDVSQYVQKVMDIMVDNQLRNGEKSFGRLLAIRGSRVDARGIEVQGELDADGQRIVQVVKRSKSLTKEDIDNRIDEAMNRMGSADRSIAEEAAIEYAGLQIAREYVEDISESKAEETALRDSIRQAKEDKDAGQMTEDAYRQYVASTEDAIRQNKIERAEAFHSLVEQVGGVLNESVERAKAWREAEKQRVEEIHHNANSDMEGRPTDEHHKDDRVQKLANNSGVRFLLAPLATFDQMLRMFGRKNVRGEGYLWNRYMRGWVSAAEKEYTGYRDALKVLDAKVSEVFGKKMTWGDLFSIDRKLPNSTVRFWDGGEMKEHELTQGNLLYIYMADKMSDGRMKLRRMGITEEDIEDIKNFLDPKFIQLADWMQEEFLVDKRNEYNEIHKRMFGASMAAIENYFPLKILANARPENVDVADDSTDTALPATSTGSIIKRRRNNLALDVTGANAFSVILDHLQQMERWAAFAEFNRDLNTLLSYKRFRNQVMNMSSGYGGGKTLWNNFRNVCSMAAGAYRPPIAALDKSAVNIAKGVTAAKVSFRLFTALKQFLSMPAYISDSNPMYLAANIANPTGAWRWSMKNLPLFEKRWSSRMAGDPRLLKSDMDWKMWRSRIGEIASRVGMSPNAFVDALTVAIGSHSMYQTKLAKYKRQGYAPDVAEARAKQDATILFNQTQQSSEGAFLSTMQVDRSWLSVLFTVFRNSSMSYTRQVYDAIRNLGHRLAPGYKGLSEEFMAKQMRRDGIDPDKADRNARQEYRRGIIRDLVRVGVFGYVLQLAWNLGAYLPYLILGEDDDEKDKMWQDVWNHSMFGSIEGLTGGDVISAAGNMLVSGEGSLRYLTKDMPLASDVVSILNKMDKDQVSAMNDVVNLLAQSYVGVDPRTLTDAVVAVMDYCGDDAETSRECALLIARVLSCPQSQLDKIYFDELDASGEEANQMTPSEIAERYARYKVRRGAPLTGWAYGSEKREEIMEKYRKRSNTIAKERLQRESGKTIREMLSGYETEYEDTDARFQAIKKVREQDMDRYYELFDELMATPEYERYQIMRGYKRGVDAVTKDWLRAKSAEERDSCVQAIMKLKQEMLTELGATAQ